MGDEGGIRPLDELREARGQRARGSDPEGGGRAKPPPAWLAALAGVAAVVAIVVLAWMAGLDLPPRGLVDLTFAGTPERASSLLSTGPWIGAIDEARRAVAWDFLLIVAYVVAIAGAARWAGPHLESRPMRSAAGPVAVAALVTGALDCVENFGLIRMLGGHTNNPWPLITTAAAWPKFIIFFATLAYAAGAVSSRLKAWLQSRARRRRGKPPGRLSLAVVPQSPPNPPNAGPTAGQVDRGDVPSWRAKEWQPTEGKTGICCSGGGIRSAAFNLGALQALDDEGELEKARYISAVSGGSYIVAARAIVERETKPELQSLFYPPDGVSEFALRSPEERHLRSNTSYLAPSLSGKLRFAARVLVGLLVNVGLVWLALFAITRPMGWVLGTPSVHGELSADPLGDLVIGPALWVTVAWPAVVGILAGLLAVTRRYRHDAGYRRTVGVCLAALTVAAVLFMFLILLPWVGVAVPRAFRAFVHWLFGARPKAAEARNYVWLLQVLGLASLGTAVLRVLSRRAGRIALAAAGILFPLTILISAGLLVVDGARRGARGPVLFFGFNAGTQLGWFVATSTLLLVFYGLSDQTTWSMHPFYKRRLSLAFAVKRDGPDSAGPVDYDQLQRLSRYDRWRTCTSDPSGHTCDPTHPHRCADPQCPHECRRRPELVVCASANISDPGAVPTGRHAVAFTFGPEEVGGKGVGWIRTQDMEKAMGPLRAEDITLPAAVAISGAAISPAMGKMTRPSVRSLLAVANARLGVWIPNPAWIQRFSKSENPGDVFHDRPRLLYLFKEILGWHRRGDKFLYVTDGGHVENLGLVELLRRGCTMIYCFDAAGDDIHTFFTLGEAVALARTELGVEIDIDPEALEPLPPEPGADPREHRSPRDSVVATFTYPSKGGHEGLSGRLVYTKTAIVESDPWDVKAYGEKDETFPTLGTVHQLYLEERFEAYRALGHAAGQHAVASMRSGESITRRLLKAIEKVRVP